MVVKSFRKKIRRVKRWLLKRRIALSIAAALLIIAGLIYNSYMQNRRLTVDPMTYHPLLQVIAKAESKGNYNAYFGNASNSSIDFTNMTIADVLKWQAEHVQQGNPSSAVGRYQFINTTLSELVSRLDIDTSEKFDQSTQDKLAIALLERRGADNYINNELSAEEFAANLAKEWAGLPKVVGENPNDSYYASDGLNKARVKTEEVLKSIEAISPE